MPRQCKMAGMTENSEKLITHDKSADEATSVPDQPPVDFLLQAIVDLANTTGIEMGITLCVGGMVVSGVLISGKTYFEEIANDTLQSSGPADQAEVRQGLSDYLGNLGKLIYGQTVNEEQAGNKGDQIMKRLPRYIHLRNAKVFHNSGQPMPENRGLWWRGRLSAVDGFSFGVLSAS